MKKSISLFSLLALATPLCAEPAYSWFSLHEAAGSYLPTLSSMSATSLDESDHAINTASKKMKPLSVNVHESQASEMSDLDSSEETSEDVTDDMENVPASSMVAVPTVPPVMNMPAPVVSAPAPAPYMPPMR